jgi:TolB-like protein
MRTTVFFACGCLLLAVLTHAIAETPDIDTSLSTMATSLATNVSNQGKKKVAVVDFTDLQGSTQGELGKYVAEQLTVDLVMAKRDFAVLDRANLQKILAEHKLTSRGLIDPDNAKKLGMFAGVDALILGTIIPKSAANIALNAKIIRTDTAEIIGATRGEFKTDDVVRELLSHAATPENAPLPTEAPDPVAAALKKPFGDLQAKIESLRLSTPPDLYGFATLTLIVSNTSNSETYGVAFPPDRYRDIDFRNSRQDWFEVTDVAGIESAFEQNGQLRGSLTDIPPQTSISVVAKSQVRWNGKPGDYRPYRFQTMVIFGHESKGQYNNVRKYNLILEIK